MCPHCVSRGRPPSPKPRMAPTWASAPSSAAPLLRAPAGLRFCQEESQASHRKGLRDGTRVLASWAGRPLLGGCSARRGRAGCRRPCHSHLPRASLKTQPRRGRASRPLSLASLKRWPFPAPFLSLLPLGAAAGAQPATTGKRPWSPSNLVGTMGPAGGPRPGPGDIDWLRGPKASASPITTGTPFLPQMTSGEGSTWPQSPDAWQGPGPVLPRARGPERQQS